MVALRLGKGIDERSLDVGVEKTAVFVGYKFTASVIVARRIGKQRRGKG